MKLRWVCLLAGVGLMSLAGCGAGGVDGGDLVDVVDAGDAGDEPGDASASRFASVTLAWDANSELDLAGYRVYARVADGGYGPPRASTAATMFTLSGLERGLTYTFRVTAYDNADRESAPSDEVSVALP